VLAIIKLQTTDFLIFYATNVLRKMNTGINKPHATNRKQSPSFGVHSLELFVSRHTVLYEECIWNKNSHILLQFGSITRTSLGYEYCSMTRRAHRTVSRNGFAHLEHDNVSSRCCRADTELLLRLAYDFVTNKETRI